MRMDLRLRFDYGHIIPWVHHVGGDLVAIAGPDAVWLRTPVDVRGENMASVADFSVGEGFHAPFVLTWRDSHLPTPHPVDPIVALEATEAYWREWVDRCTYKGEWRDAVVRSLLTLKTLTYGPTGGIVAAVTTSLPEALGGVRNWDYRFCWLRDATITLQALMYSGYVEEARAWRQWLLRAIAGDPAELQIMYGVAGNAGSMSGLPTGCPATAATPCVSATPPPSSSSSTSTARSWTPSTRRGRPGWRRTSRRGPCRWHSWTSSSTTGPGPMRASGRCVAVRVTSPTPS